MHRSRWLRSFIGMHPSASSGLASWPEARRFTRATLSSLMRVTAPEIFHWFIPWLAAQAHCFLVLLQSYFSANDRA